MKIRIWPKSRLAMCGILVMAVLIMPFLFSRVASPWRRIIPRTSSQPAEHSDAGRVGYIRVASYNIAHGRGIAESNWDGGTATQRLERLDAIADLLVKVDADVVVLNEVDFQSSWSGSVNQAEHLANRAGYPYWVEQRNLDFRFMFWTWRFGNAILSKTPITDAELVPLPSFASWESVLAGKKRGVRARVDAVGQTVQIVAVHLSHRSEALRVESAERISTLVAEKKLPTLVLGDMNSTPRGFPASSRTGDGRNAMDTLDASGLFRRTPVTAPVSSSELTFHSDKPKLVIDWILIPSGWTFRSHSVHSSKLSDHRLIYADITPAEFLGSTPLSREP